MAVRSTIPALLFLGLLLGLLPAPAFAGQGEAPAAEPASRLPLPVRQMIEAAIATGDKTKVDVVVELARKTYPAADGEIDALRKTFLDEQTRRTSREASEKEAKIRSAGLFEQWKGKGELGGNRATGTNDDLGVTAALTLERKGIDWSHKLRLQIDYQATNGETSRERYFAAYEPRYIIHNGLFTYALAQFESDRIQGYDERYTLSGGIGYKLIDKDGLDLSVKGGPTFRYTHYRGQPAESRAAALLGLDFAWEISPRVKFTQGLNAISQGGASALLVVDGANTSLDLTSALDTKMSDSLAIRLSYDVNYNSNPPAGVVKTGTLSRFSLVYGF